MKIIICGAGQVGTSIATQLASENNDITVIDQNAELTARISDTLEVRAITGFASHPGVLEEAGAEDADMVIAVTYSDEVNMVTCQIAHSLFHVPMKIARVRHQNYLAPEWRGLYQQDNLPIDVIISPEIEVARIINERLHAPGAIDMLSFADGKIKVMAIRCTNDCTMLNLPLYKVMRNFVDLDISVVAIVRDGNFIIASVDDELLFNDEVYFVVNTKQLDQVMELFGYEKKEAQRIIIVGGGNIGLFLAGLLEAEHNSLSVKIIELSKERAEYIAERLSDTTVINGSALDQSILDEVNISRAEAIIAVSNDDKVNILSSLLAKRSGCQRAITLLNNNTAYGQLVASLGVDVIVNPRETTVSSILRHTRMGQIRTVYSIANGKAEIMEAEVVDGSPIIGKNTQDLDIPDEVTVVAVWRQNEVIIPDNETVINVGDRIIILCMTEMAKKVEKIFSVSFEYF
jgi:trk system potassium uptake protein